MTTSFFVIGLLRLNLRYKHCMLESPVLLNKKTGGLAIAAKILLFLINDTTLI